MGSLPPWDVHRTEDGRWRLGGVPHLVFFSFAPLNLATNGTRGHDRSWPVAEGRGVVVGICTGAALDGLALHCIVHAGSKTYDIISLSLTNTIQKTKKKCFITDRFVANVLDFSLSFDFIAYNEMRTSTNRSPCS